MPCVLFASRRNTRYAWRPSFAAAAAVCRLWFDWDAAPVITESAPCLRISPKEKSNFRVLLPPNANPVRSSRLIRMRGPPNSSERRGQSCRGVGRSANRTCGNVFIAARNSSGDIGTFGLDIACVSFGFWFAENAPTFSPT